MLASRRFESALASIVSKLMERGLTPTSNQRSQVGNPALDLFVFNPMKEVIHLKHIDLGPQCQHGNHGFCGQCQHIAAK